jgi:hypothetical protein
MADNLNVTPGTGAAVSTNQLGDASHAQQVKLLISAAADATRIPATVAYGLLVDVSRIAEATTLPKAGQVWPVSDNGANLSVDDGGGSLTVDAPAATPVAVRLSTGSAFIDTIPVSDGAGSLTVDGGVTAAQGAPIAVASAWPMKVSDGTDTVGISTVGGVKALKVDVVQEAGPVGTRVTKSVTLAAGETGTTLWDPAAGYKFVITDILIAMQESGRVTIFDQTNSAANIIFDGEIYGPPYHFNFQARPWRSAAADNILKATTDGDAACTITVHGYEV